jgi:hypothetical protein
VSATVTALTGGTIGSDRSICNGATAEAFTSISAASGGIGTITYQWQSSTDNGTSWNNITGETSETYAPTGAFTTTTQYKRNASNSCGTVSSNTITITVHPPLSGGIIKMAEPQEYCYGITPSILYGVSPATGGSGSSNYSYQWESSTDNSTFTNMSGATSETYSPGALTQTTYYRRLVTDGYGCSVSSDTLEIKVLPLPVVSVSDTALCTGLIRELFPNTGGYWTSSDISIAVVSSNNMFVTGKSAGKASLTFTDTVGGGCSESIVVEVRDFPDVSDIIGKHVVCKDATVELTNPTTIPIGGGWDWRKNNDNIMFESGSEKANSVTVKGIKEGNSFVSYTVSDGICETRTTFRIKVIPDTPPRIIIGFEK